MNFGQLLGLAKQLAQLRGFAGLTRGLACGYNDSTHNPRYNFGFLIFLRALGF